MRTPPRLAALAFLGVLASAAPLVATSAAAAPAPTAVAPTAAGGSAAPAVTPSASPSPATAAGPSGISATGADLVNTGTGQMLWKRDLNTKRPIASITKVMTALVVLHGGNLARKIKIPNAVVGYVNKYGASSAGLVPGDTLTTLQLLKGLLLPSGCDAAYVLATAYGPGRTAFVTQMNTMAQQMGLTHTHFSNFDGLPWPTATDTYSSPADLIKLGEAAMAQATFRGIVHRQTYTLAATSAHHAYTWANTNLLLGSYAGATGIKTGSTSAAGYCLLFEADDNGQVLIGVVLHSTATNPDDRFSDATAMLNWGFGVPATPAAAPSSAPAITLPTVTFPGS